MNTLKIILELALLCLAGAAFIYLKKSKNKIAGPQKIALDEKNNFIIKNNTVISPLNSNNTVIENADISLLNIDNTRLTPVFDLTRIRSLNRPAAVIQRKFRKPVYRKTVYSEYFGQMAIIETIRETDSSDEVEAILSEGLSSALAGIEPFKFDGLRVQLPAKDGNIFESATGATAYDMYLNDEADFDIKMEAVETLNDAIEVTFGNEGLTATAMKKPVKKTVRRTKKETRGEGGSDLEPPDI